MNAPESVHKLVVQAVLSSSSMEMLACTHTSPDYFDRLELPPEVKARWWYCKLGRCKEGNSYYQFYCWFKHGPADVKSRYKILFWKSLFSRQGISSITKILWLCSQLTKGFRESMDGP